jgi:hypothetical protein
MMDLIALALQVVGSVTKIATEAMANAQAAEADALARLKLVLADALVVVDARLGQLDAARTDADRRIDAAGPRQSDHAVAGPTIADGIG